MEAHREEEMAGLVYDVMTNQNLSLKAKSIYIIILTNPEIFEITGINKPDFIAANCSDGTASIMKGVYELEDAGFLRRTIIRATEGRQFITGSTWRIMDKRGGLLRDVPAFPENGRFPETGRGPREHFAELIAEKAKVGLEQLKLEMGKFVENMKDMKDI